MLNFYGNILNDLNDLDEDLEDIYLESLSNELDCSGMLIPNYKNSNLPGKFADNKWVFISELTKTYLIIDFQKLEEFKFVKLRKRDIIRVKIYISYLLLDNDLEISTVAQYFSNIVKFFKVTDFMDEDHLSSLTDLIMDEVNKYTYGHTFSIIAFDYLNFLINNLHIQDLIYTTYRNFLAKLNPKIKLNQTSRTLPSSKDIMFFNYYIDQFFNDTSIVEELKLLFKPIHIWWKLTNIIPMRPSEFCVKLERDCIIEENGNFFIKINRIKENRSNKFPVLKKVQLNDTIATLILEYINKTNKFGHTETLFSYIATSKLRGISHSLGYNTRDLSSTKYDKNYFTRSNFANLLKLFYYMIIKGIYNDDSYNRQVKPGDTRHFAFFSLLMQGISPIEIALLGGHSTLEMQVNYQNCIEYYVGTELYEFLNEKSDKSNEKIYQSLNDIINSLPKTCKKPLHKRYPLEVGYCLCDFNVDSCDNVDEFCCFCTKWWAEPTRITYDRLRLQIENKLKELGSNTFLKLSALEELLCRNYTFKSNYINMNSYIDTKSTINEIRNSCDKIVGLKLSLIADNFNKIISDKCKKKESIND